MGANAGGNGLLTDVSMASAVDKAPLMRLRQLFLAAANEEHALVQQEQVLALQEQALALQEQVRAQLNCKNKNFTLYSHLGFQPVH